MSTSAASTSSPASTYSDDSAGRANRAPLSLPAERAGDQLDLRSDRQRAHDHVAIVACRQHPLEGLPAVVGLDAGLEEALEQLVGRETFADRRARSRGRGVAEGRTLGPDHREVLDLGQDPARRDRRS